MATNASEHLGLHLWEPTDQVLRTEFNQNWTKIDTAVNAAQETAEAAQPAQDLSAASAVLMEKESGAVLYEKDARQKLEPASVTKIMTLLLVMEAVDSGRIPQHATQTTITGNIYWVRLCSVLSQNAASSGLTIA